MRRQIFIMPLGAIGIGIGRSGSRSFSKGSPSAVENVCGLESRQRSQVNHGPAFSAEAALSGAKPCHTSSSLN